MKIMQQIQIAIRMRPGAARAARQQAVPRRRFSVRRVAIGIALIQCLTLAYAADPLPAQAPDRPPGPAQKPAYVPQGHQMQRYQAFARQAKLPLMTITNQTELEVGETVKSDVTRLAQVSSREKEALAGQFGVPVGVMEVVVQRVASSSPPSAAQLAQELRTAVIDYRFLQIEWDRYHPPAEGQTTRATALAALQAGDISKAWELYDGLHKPQAPAVAPPAPPANLRVIAQP